MRDVTGSFEISASWRKLRGEYPWIITMDKQCSQTKFLCFSKLLYNNTVVARLPLDPPRSVALETLDDTRLFIFN